MVYEMAEKATLNGILYVRVPLTFNGAFYGSFYFTKSKTGQLQKTFVVNNSNTLKGKVGFVDFDNQTYSAGVYVNNKLSSLYPLKDSKTFFAGILIDPSNNSSSLVRSTNGCSEGITTIIQLPNGKDSIIQKSIDSGPNTSCPGTKNIWQILWGGISDFFGDVFDFFTNLFAAGGDGSSSGSPASSFPNLSYTDFSTIWTGGGGGSNWSSYYTALDNSVSADSYNASEEIDNNDNDLGADNSIYQQIDPTQTVQTIRDIIGPQKFVKRLTSYQNCLELSRQQIAVLGYKVGGYDPGGQTFQIYTRSGGIDKAAALSGVSYLVGALSKGVPVVIGVDYGHVSPNLDNTTNHFVVVVGMGNDENGNIFFRFYDNFTANTTYGTSGLNTVTYDPVSGSLTGSFVGVPDQGIAPIKYKVAQIRKSFR
jgi:hypothetical protein